MMCENGRTRDRSDIRLMYRDRGQLEYRDIVTTSVNYSPEANYRCHRLITHDLQVSRRARSTKEGTTHRYTS